MKNPLFKRFFLFSLLLMLPFILNAQRANDEKLTIKGSKNIVTQKRDITADFNTIEAYNQLKVYITQAAEMSVKVEANDNVIDLIQADSKDGILSVYIKDTIQLKKATAKVYVTLPVIKELKATGFSEFYSDHILTGDEITLDAIGFSKMDLVVKANKVMANTIGFSKITLKGVTNVLDTQATGFSSVHAKKLSVDKCEAHADGFSKIKVNASKNLSKSVSGFSKVKNKHKISNTP